VAKAGARIWTGDVHALQGDGVVDQTAPETVADDLEIRYDLHKGVPLRGPLGETKTAWIVIGFGANLDDALVACLRETVHWLAEAAQITESEVYALASMPVSFRVTQYANQTWSAYSSIPAKAVHVVILKTIFPAEIQNQIGAWLRSAGPAV
jgi:acetamidase/formamidase